MNPRGLTRSQGASSSGVFAVGDGRPEARSAATRARRSPLSRGACFVEEEVPRGVVTLGLGRQSGTVCGTGGQVGADSLQSYLLRVDDVKGMLEDKVGKAERASCQFCSQ